MKIKNKTSKKRNIFILVIGILILFSISFVFAEETKVCEEVGYYAVDKSNCYEDHIIKDYSLKEGESSSMPEISYSNTRIIYYPEKKQIAKENAVCCQHLDIGTLYLEQRYPATIFGEGIDYDKKIEEFGTSHRISLFKDKSEKEIYLIMHRSEFKNIDKNKDSYIDLNKNGITKADFYTNENGGTYNIGDLANEKYYEIYIPPKSRLFFNGREINIESSFGQTIESFPKMHGKGEVYNFKIKGDGTILPSGDILESGILNYRNGEYILERKNKVVITTKDGQTYDVNNGKGDDATICFGKSEPHTCSKYENYVKFIDKNNIEMNSIKGKDNKINLKAHQRYEGVFSSPRESATTNVELSVSDGNKITATYNDKTKQTDLDLMDNRGITMIKNGPNTLFSRDGNLQAFPGTSEEHNSVNLAVQRNGKNILTMDGKNGYKWDKDCDEKGSNCLTVDSVEKYTDRLKEKECVDLDCSEFCIKRETFEDEIASCIEKCRKKCKKPGVPDYLLPSEDICFKKDSMASTPAVKEFLRREGLSETQIHWSNRKEIAEKYGIYNFRGTAKQNKELLNKMCTVQRIGFNPLYTKDIEDYMAAKSQAIDMEKASQAKEEFDEERREKIKNQVEEAAREVRANEREKINEYKNRIDFGGTCNEIVECNLWCSRNVKDVSFERYYCQKACEEDCESKHLPNKKTRQRAVKKRGNEKSKLLFSRTEVCLDINNCYCTYQTGNDCDNFIRICGIESGCIIIGSDPSSEFELSDKRLLKIIPKFRKKS